MGVSEVGDCTTTTTMPPPPSPPHNSRRVSTTDEASSTGVTLLSYRSNRAFVGPSSSLPLSLHGSDDAAVVVVVHPSSSQSSSPTLRRGDSTSSSKLPSMSLPLRPPALLPSTLLVPTDRRSVETESMFDLVARAQAARLNEQRCELPKHLLQNAGAEQHQGMPGGAARRLASGQSPPLSLQLHPCKQQQPANGDVDRLLGLLRGPGPYPMVVVPSAGSYWAEGFIEDGGGATSHRTSAKRGAVLHSDAESDAVDSDDLEADDAVNHYKEHFAGQEHLNYLANDDVYGPTVLSLKKCPLGPGCQEVAHAIMRTRARTARCILALDGDEGCHEPSIASLAKACCDEVTTSRFYPITFLGASKLISEYDERFVTRQFKFGIVYQKFGQVMEEDLFANCGGSPAFEDFLNLLGDRVALQGFEGFRGGLDTQLGQTGRESVYTRYHGRELMFHVSTLLPYAEGDSQQVQRKRHIGNDIVAIVFQESSTPFIPNAITSQFLHAYIVVQPITVESGEAAFKVSVSARSDVPRFGPKLKSPAIYRKDEHFRNFLLTKLLNAEHACEKAPQFAEKMERTRTSYLTDLHAELFHKTAEAMLASGDQQHHNERSEGGLLGSIKRLAMRKAAAAGESLLKKVDSHVSKDQHHRRDKKKMSAPSLRDVVASGGSLLRPGSSWDEKMASTAFANSRQSASLHSIVSDPVPTGKNAASAGAALSAAARSTSMLRLHGAASAAASSASLECSGYDDCMSSSASSSPSVPRKTSTSCAAAATTAAAAAAADDAKLASASWCNSPSSACSSSCCCCGDVGSSTERDDCFHNCDDSDTGIASLSPAITPCSTLDLARGDCHSGVGGNSEKPSSVTGQADPCDYTFLKREVLDLKHKMSALQSENWALRKELRQYSEKGDCCNCPRCASYRKLSSSYAVASEAAAQDVSVGSEVESHQAVDLRSPASSTSPDLKKLCALAGVEGAIV